jgi:hypothetical protein
MPCDLRFLCAGRDPFVPVADQRFSVPCGLSADRAVQASSGVRPVVRYYHPPAW